MKPQSARPMQSLQWIPAERLGGLRVDPGLRAWLMRRAPLLIQDVFLPGMGLDLRPDAR